MVAKTLLICFIPEINKSQLAIVDTDALSDNEVNGPVANIKNVNEKVHETSWNTSKSSEKHGKNTPFRIWMRSFSLSDPLHVLGITRLPLPIMYGPYHNPLAKAFIPDLGKQGQNFNYLYKFTSIDFQNKNEFNW